MGIDFSKTIVDGSGNPNYGLVPHNPVFVNGPMGTQRYLDRLKPPNGDSIRWERKGSLQTANISGNTDIYFGYLSDGSVYIKIFVNWYGIANSDTAPKGLILV